MPKVGMEAARRQQLIDATFASVSKHGMQASTITTICREAGLSTGLISHYFGNKQGLIEASLRYLLTQLHHYLVEHTHSEMSAQQRLDVIVEANFSRWHLRGDTSKTWLSFWAQSLHNSSLRRLQQVSSRRLISNLSFSFQQVMSQPDAQQSAHMAAAMIDGLWLRAVLGGYTDAQIVQSETFAKQYISSLITRYGECHNVPGL
ncbi:BetI family transcriptional regulator [Vibrio sp. qd031]|uniref:transcriptional regulator BetI n=1 Tax=Vibrio sp. qd031 TaxID=1603038 RepID=UPI000A11B6C8|nr:transcriptional regulator BetI [Vibrio sp. qd031]ORT50570.1 BetI family transcriptional regulator [Vibrio sp. qd031]